MSIVYSLYILYLRILYHCTLYIHLICKQIFGQFHVILPIKVNPMHMSWAVPSMPLTQFDVWTFLPQQKHRWSTTSGTMLIQSRVARGGEMQAMDQDQQ